ncbi:N-myc-interactor isoform X2 [Elgaria multicarinata webbii]
MEKGSIPGALVKETENPKELEQLKISSSTEKSDIPGSLINEMENLKELEQLKSMEKGEIPGALVNEKELLNELKALKINSSAEKGEIPGALVNEMENLMDLGMPKANSMMKKDEVSDIPVILAEKRKELEEWKARVVIAEKQKSDMLLLKLHADERRRKNQEELTKLKDLENKVIQESMKVQEDHKRELSSINEQNKVLKKEIEILKAKIAAMNAKHEEHARNFRLKKYIPEKKMIFSRLENITNEDDCMNISCLFHITTKLPFTLSKGEALITFEEENVAQGLIRKHYHTVNMENEKMVLRARPVILETGVTFELHAKISQMKVNVSSIPDLNIPEEWMRDKLELYFCKTKLGGGVQKVTYDHWSHMALITFDQPIAANNIVGCELRHFHAHGRTHNIMVSPVIQNKVERLQIFAGISRKTILLTGIKVEEEDEESVQDMIAIHFQKPSNGGGEVESVKYVSKGTKVAYFENDTEDVK